MAKFVSVVALTQRTTNPSGVGAGEMYYNTDANEVRVFTGSAWVALGSGAAVLPSGGLEGQILAKTTDSDYATGWIDNYAKEVRFICKNDSGSTIAKGVPVYAVGAVGDTIQIAPAIANGSIDPHRFLGVTAQSIANSSTGYVNILGEIKGVDTTSFSLGDLLYISPTTAGTFTTTHPTAPNPSDAIAIVTKIGNSTAGRIVVRMWRQSNKISDIFDVNLSGLADGDTLVYDTTTSTWLPGASTGGVYNWSTTLDGGSEPSRIQYAEITGGRITELVDGGGVS
jgi:hypothetical protein